MEKNISEKSEKSEKLVELFNKKFNASIYYSLEKNLNTGIEKIKLTDKGYEKLTEFFYNNDNIKLYNINAYYIEKLNDIKNVYEEKIDRDGVILEKTHTYYSAISSKYIEYELFKTVLDM